MKITKKAAVASHMLPSLQVDGLCLISIIKVDSMSS